MDNNKRLWHRLGVKTMSAIIQTDGRYQQIESVLNGLTSEHSKRAYKRALTDFVDWHTQQGQPALTKATVNAYKAHLLDTGKSTSVVNQSLCAIRKLVREAADNGAVDPIHAQVIANVKGVKSQMLPAGHSLSQDTLS
jgi:site-specific recombinase XerD